MTPTTMKTSGSVGAYVPAVAQTLIAWPCWAASVPVVMPGPPATLGVMKLAFLFVLLEIPLPGVINDTLVTVSNATSACCMMYLGALLCFSKWTDALKCKELYVGILVKMIVLPIIGGKILFALGWPVDVATSMIVLMSLPVMTVVPMIATQRGHEGDYAAGIAVATLVASVATIPLVQLLVTL